MNKKLKQSVQNFVTALADSVLEEMESQINVKKLSIKKSVKAPVIKPSKPAPKSKQKPVVKTPAKNTPIRKTAVHNPSWLKSAILLADLKKSAYGSRLPPHRQTQIVGKMIKTFQKLGKFNIDTMALRLRDKGSRQTAGAYFGQVTRRGNSGILEKLYAVTPVTTVAVKVKKAPTIQAQTPREPKAARKVAKVRGASNSSHAALVKDLNSKKRLSLDMDKVKTFLAARVKQWAKNEMRWLKKMDANELAEIFGKKLATGEKISHADFIEKTDPAYPSQPEVQGFSLAMRKVFETNKLNLMSNGTSAPEVAIN